MIDRDNAINYLCFHSFLQIKYTIGDSLPSSHKFDIKEILSIKPAWNLIQKMF